MIALALSLVALQDPDPLEKELDALIERMRISIAERKVATDRLLEIRRKAPRALRFLRLRANAEKDVRVRVRLEYVAGTRLLLWCWQMEAPPTTRAAVCEEGILLERPAANVFFDAATGVKKWEFKAPSAWTRTPLFSGGRVFIVLDGVGHRPLRIVDVDNGRVKQGPALMPEPAVPLAAGDGCVALSTLDGRVRFGKADLKKTFQAVMPLRARFALASDRLYVHDGDATLYAFDAATGKKAWTAASDQGLDFLGASAGAVITRCTRDRIRAHDPATGKELWKEDVPDEDTPPPVTVLERVVITATPQVRCRDIATGRLLWTAETAGADRPRADQLHLVGAHAFYASGGVAHAIHLETARVEPLEIPEIGPIVRLEARGQMVYVFTQDGRLIAFRVQP